MKKKAPVRKFKSFSDMHGSKSDVFRHVTPEQLGHDQQLQVNPQAERSSPLINPGDPNHVLGMAAGNDPSGEDFY